MGMMLSVISDVVAHPRELILNSGHYTQDIVKEENCAYEIGVIINPIIRSTSSV